MSPASKRALLIVASMLGCFVVLRVSLYISPHSNFDIGPYNIHHLFTGILVMLIFGMPLILFNGKPLFETLNSIGFGAGLGMVLDEWVYLIATDGSDKSYLTPVSFWGGVIVILIAVVYIVLLLLLNRQR